MELFLVILAVSCMFALTGISMYVLNRRATDAWIRAMERERVLEAMIVRYETEMAANREFLIEWRKG